MDNNKEKLINHIEVFKDSINQIEEYANNNLYGEAENNMNNEEDQNFLNYVLYS